MAQSRFDEVLIAAMEDLVEHGYDDQHRVAMWMEMLREAAEAAYMPSDRSPVWRVFSVFTTWGTSDVEVSTAATRPSTVTAVMGAPGQRSTGRTIATGGEGCNDQGDLASTVGVR